MPSPRSNSHQEYGTKRKSTQEANYVPEFTEDGQLILPPAEVWRTWPYIGTPLTPNALNGGEAAFPEFHSVYIDPVSWEHWRKTGEFRDGTVIAKELTLVDSVDAFPDGSTQQVSGRGYFMGDFSGFEIAYKSAKRFPGVLLWQAKSDSSGSQPVTNLALRPQLS